jgi:YbbR domain-containing protein
MARWLFQDWQLKALSLAVAVVVWFLVVSGDRSHVAFAAPVEFVGLGDGMVLVGNPPYPVDLQIDAPRWAASQLTTTNVRVRVNLAALGEGDHAVPLGAQHVQAPAGVRVTRITPSWLRVTLARATTRTMRVVPQIRGAPAPRHALYGVQVEPPAVEVRGPRSTIEARDTVETVPVDVSGSRERISQAAALLLPDGVYPTSQRTVQVTVDIRREDL